MTEPAGMDEREALLDEQFPGRHASVYANHAAISPWPRRTAEAVTAFARENVVDGPARYAEWLRRAQRLRERIARLLNAEGADDIALTANTTEGIDIVARGLPWREGDNIVTAEGEFPSNRLAWSGLSERGVSLRTVDIRAAADAESALLAQVDRRTRLVTVSAVQWTDGFRLDLERLGRGCHELDTMLFVDAIQQFGALPVDVRGYGIDLLAAGSHKWQMGPEGIGVFYAHSRAREMLSAGRVGWRMFEYPYRFDAADNPVAEAARRFEAGSPNTVGQVALEASLGLLEDVGPDWAAKRILANTDRLHAALASMQGIETVSPPAPVRRAGIVSFTPGGPRPKVVVGELAKRGIVCAARGHTVRVSMHWYQGSREVDRVLNAIEDVAVRS